MFGCGPNALYFSGNVSPLDMVLQSSLQNVGFLGQKLRSMLLGMANDSVFDVIEFID